MLNFEKDIKDIESALLAKKLDVEMIEKRILLLKEEIIKMQGALQYANLCKAKDDEDKKSLSNQKQPEGS